jgi:glutamate synthase (NADPH) large chain
MSGGVAYVYDPDGQFSTLCNPAMVDIETLSVGDDGELGAGKPSQRGSGVNDNGMGDMLRHHTDRVKILLQRHYLHTGSRQAKALLDDWKAAQQRFVKVMPRDYRRALQQLEAENAATLIAAE